jgi:2',3'-cyclic-nucleotide 2'-phosphodiesterase (5'-nucleotidase family)
MKRLTILHSNDLHGDFLAEEIDERLIGGVSMLSGYLSKVLDEYLSCHQNLDHHISGRLAIE